MYTFDRYIGQKVRRYVYALCVDGTYYHLMTIYEHLESDMADILAYKPTSGNQWLKRDDKVDSKQPKVYVCVEEFTFTEELFRSPWSAKNTISLTDKYGYKIVTHNGFDIIHLSDENRHSIANILPYRLCPAYISYYESNEPIEQLQIWLADEKIRKQLSKLSIECFGYDICQWNLYIGKYIFVSYNPIYRNIHWREDDKNPGIYCRINYRNGIRGRLKFKFKGYDELDAEIFEKIDTSDAFLNKFTFPQPFKYLKVWIYDKEGILIDYYHRMNFIHQIKMDMQIHEKTVRVVNEDGEVMKEIDKFRAADSLKIGKPLPISHFDEDIYAYKRLEDSLDFVFFEGDRNGDDTNRKKGIDIIKRIINSAKERCYICDTYFGTKDFNDFILDTPSLDVEVNILTSKKAFKKAPEETISSEEKEKKFTDCIDEYNKEIGGNVIYKILSNNPILHDRLIIADDQVWMLGSSLNHFGANATTLIRVPKAYRGRIIGEMEKMWDSVE